MNILTFKRLSCVLLLLCLPRIARATAVDILEDVWDMLIFWEDDSNHRRRHKVSNDPPGSSVPEIVIDILDDEPDAPGEWGGTPQFPDVPIDEGKCGGPRDPLEDLIAPPTFPGCDPGQDLGLTLPPGDGSGPHSPVPEPLSVLLLSFGAGAIAAASRRRFPRSSAPRA
ncbi:MAG TPA: PEP-CTERM sorting domain-containing protein [Planctomycetota bacterium]|nr:PEP-CTERM sorting domain-containing protein [Planctomycetota bacterium]